MELLLKLKVLSLPLFTQSQTLFDRPTNFERVAFHHFAERQGLIVSFGTESKGFFGTLLTRSDRYLRTFCGKPVLQLGVTCVFFPDFIPLSDQQLGMTAPPYHPYPQTHNTCNPAGPTKLTAYPPHMTFSTYRGVRT